MRFGILPLLVLVESVIGLEDGSIRQKEKDLTELRSLDRGRRQASSDIVNGGCYEDKPARMLTGKGELHLANNSPNACNSYCQGFKYYGVQYTNQCFCGDTLHHLVKKPENECNAECPGDSSKKCGGTWRQNLYKTSPETCPEEIFVRLSNDPNRHAQYAGKYVINGTSNHHAYYVKPPHAIHVHNSQKWTIGLILGLPLGNIMSTTIAACPTAEGLEWQYRDAGHQWLNAGEDVKILNVNTEDTCPEQLFVSMSGDAYNAYDATGTNSDLGGFYLKERHGESGGHPSWVNGNRFITYSAENEWTIGTNVDQSQREGDGWNNNDGDIGLRSTTSGVCPTGLQWQFYSSTLGWKEAEVKLWYHEK